MELEFKRKQTSISGRVILKNKDEQQNKIVVYLSREGIKEKLELSGEYKFSKIDIMKGSYVLSIEDEENCYDK